MACATAAIWLLDCSVEKKSEGEREAVAAYYVCVSIQGPVWFCSVPVNNDILIVNYGVKQSQFTKLTPEPRASDPEECIETFDRAIRGWLL